MRSSINLNFLTFCRTPSHLLQTSHYQLVLNLRLCAIRGADCELFKVRSQISYTPRRSNYDDVTIYSYKSRLFLSDHGPLYWWCLPQTSTGIFIHIMITPMWTIVEVSYHSQVHDFEFWYNLLTIKPVRSHKSRQPHCPKRSWVQTSRHSTCLARDFPDHLVIQRED